MLSAVVFALLAAPPQPTLSRVDQQEALNDRLEESFDALCSALKAGRRVLGEPLAAPSVQLPVGDLVEIDNCSLRALELKPARKDGARPIRLLWEIDGRDGSGNFVTVRGENDAAVAPTKTGWRLTELSTEGFRRLSVPSRRFVERSAASGLIVPQRTSTRLGPEAMTGGLSVRDLDGDGRPDVIVLDGPKAWLFRGAAGFTFGKPELVAEASKQTIFTSAALGDLDGDGDADLALTSYPNQPVRLFRNEGGQLSGAGTLGNGGLHQSAIFSDLDGDGRLDLAVFTYPFTARNPSSFVEAANGGAPEVWLGNADFTFRPLGFSGKPRWTLAAVAADLLRTGAVQLYLANDFGSNDLYTFTADGGATERARSLSLDDPGNGMSADVGDLDGDGRLDLYVANMFSKAGTRVLAGAQLPGTPGALLGKFARGNTLYLAQADGGFVERAVELGVNRGLWAFASLLADVDDDGRLEALVANGYLSMPKRKDT